MKKKAKIDLENKSPVLYCGRCGGIETSLNLATGKIQPVKHGLEAVSFICSDCVQQGYIEKARIKEIK